MQLKHTFNSFWAGELPPYARLAMNSYVKQGHRFLLWTYEDIEGVPSGVILKDANEILPQQAVYSTKGWRTVLSFSDWFRYKLLYERGGWWVDTDAVLLPDAIVPSGEYRFWRDDVTAVCNGVMKVPAGFRVFHELCQLYEDPANATIPWVNGNVIYEEDMRFLHASKDISSFRKKLSFDYGGPHFLRAALYYYKLIDKAVMFDSTEGPHAVWPSWRVAQDLFNGTVTLQDLQEHNCWNVHLYGSCIRRQHLWDNIDERSAVFQLINIFGC